MNDIPEPTLHLLFLLLGKRTAKRVYSGSLTHLFLDDVMPENVKARLRASRELVQRWMLEDLRRQPVLSCPNAVREYLDVHYAGQEREVFRCLFLDSRHRLIAVAEPSQADEPITARLRDALAMVEIRVLDHLIVGGATVPLERGRIYRGD